MNCHGDDAHDDGVSKEENCSDETVATSIFKIQRPAQRLIPSPRLFCILPRRTQQFSM